MKDALRLIQVPATAGPSHAFSIGVHWKMDTPFIAMTQPMVMKARMAAPSLKLRVGKMRMYIRRRESLTRPMAVQ